MEKPYGVKVRVLRISSVQDPETGKPGKQIELVEVRRRSQPLTPGVGEEARVVQSILSQFQSIGVFPLAREMMLPKLTLILTEDEYDMLGIRFEVNDTYDLLLKDGIFSLRKSAEGI